MSGEICFTKKSTDLWAVLLKNKKKTRKCVNVTMAVTQWQTQSIVCVLLFCCMKTVHRAIKEKQRGKLSQGVLLHHDNAPAHTTADAISPDLAPTYTCCDLWKIRYMDRHLSVIQAINDQFEQLDEKLFTGCIKHLNVAGKKCIAL